MNAVGDSPYAVLEVPRSADAATVEAAYHRLTGLLSDGALASYGMLDAGDVGRLRHQLDCAYAVLSDPARRRHFDATGQLDVAELGAGAPGAAPATPPGGPGAQRDGHGLPASRAPGGGGAAPGRDVAAASADAHVVRGQIDPRSADANASRPRGAPHRPAVVGRPSLVVPLLAELADDVTYDGALLRRLRQSAHVSVDELSEWTKIGRRYLQAIEDEDFALLPAKVYVRGFVGELARVLGLPARQACASYLVAYEQWAASR